MGQLSIPSPQVGEGLGATDVYNCIISSKGVFPRHRHRRNLAAAKSRQLEDSIRFQAVRSAVTDIQTVNGDSE